MNREIEKNCDLELVVCSLVSSLDEANEQIAELQEALDHQRTEFQEQMILTNAEVSPTWSVEEVGTHLWITLTRGTSSYMYDVCSSDSIRGWKIQEVANSDE